MSLVDTLTNEATLQVLSFPLGNELFAIDVTTVKEIERARPAIKIPNTLDCLEGVIRWRGQATPLLNLAKRIGAPQGDRAGDCVIIVDAGERHSALLVDDVPRIRSIDKKDISPPDALTGTTDSRYVGGYGKVDGQIIILLRMDSVLDWDAPRPSGNA